MISAELNERLTRVGPGTPGGRVLRQYWQPIALVDELEAKRPVRAVRALGQDFVLFRDEQGRLGLLDRDCPHRNADLAFGRLEDGGLRCPFHGWLFDVQGKCLDTPAEPEGSTLCTRIRQRSYPVEIRSGIVFAFLGEGAAPAFPALDCFTAPDSHTFAFKGLIACFWLQALEVGIDPAHASFLVDPKLDPSDAGQPGTPPDVALLTQGYNYLTELRYDQIDSVLEILRREIQALGLPLRSMEVEYGPSQVEFTFGPQAGLASADAMVLFRSAVKQVARRHGYHATFMCRPRIPNVMSSGWHLHQSLGREGRNAFMGDGTLLSETARHYLGGLVHHARAAAAFSTSTINGYRRYRSHSLAPDRAIWGIDNRGVMVRALGAPGDAATRLENRVGEPAANPYLYLASQLAYGLEGIAMRRDPGPPADTPYETEAPQLPRSLAEAVAALEESAAARAAFGETFVNYFARLKRAEIARFEAEVSEWEHREYFELF